jgi:cation transport regulator ChaC
MLTQKHTHTYTHIHTHVRTATHTYTQTNTYTQTHKHTDTKTTKHAHALRKQIAGAVAAFEQPSNPECLSQLFDISGGGAGPC